MDRDKWFAFGLLMFISMLIFIGGVINLVSTERIAGIIMIVVGFSIFFISFKVKAEYEGKCHP